MAYWLLLLSVILSSCRNVCSKSISKIDSGTKGFYLLQAVIFGSGVLLLMTMKGAFQPVSGLTVLLAVLYGLLLLSAQWNYTAAMQKGNVGLCATVYSLGFVLPTLSGAVFWSESLSLWQVLGIFVAVMTFVVSGIWKRSEKGLESYFLRLIAAMLSSGGLGVLQKIQQSTPYADQKTQFVLIAMALAAGFSMICFYFANSGDSNETKRNLCPAAVIGLCFGASNLLNTMLSGMLPSATVFPLLNIGSIMCSTAIGLLVFREGLNLKTGVVLTLGTVAIILIGVA